MSRYEDRILRFPLSNPVTEYASLDEIADDTSWLGFLKSLNNYLYFSDRVYLYCFYKFKIVRHRLSHP